MNARQYLKSLRNKESRIQIKMRQIQKLRDRLLSTSAPMDKEQVSHTTNVSVMADTIAMIVDMQKEVEAQTVEYLKQKWEAMKLLDQIEPESAEILIDRYFEGKTFTEIGKERFISGRQAQRREYAAIREFQRVLDSNQAQEAC